MRTPFRKRFFLIAVCQLTAVLSCVSIWYLTVAVYVPAYRTLNSDFSEQTVMCTTVSKVTLKNCKDKEGFTSWSSCGEWCMSRATGPCTQIRVDVRRNGSDVRLEECDPSAFDTKYCDGIDLNMKVYDCINGECASLHGIFNCTKGDDSPGETYGATCKNLTSILSCNVTTTDAPIFCNTRKACLQLDGIYECNYGECARLRPPIGCDKGCIDIKTYQKDVIIRQGNTIHTARCARARDLETGIEFWPRDLDSHKFPGRPPMMMLFCTSIVEVPNDKITYMLSDCFNGTLLEPDHFSKSTNITYLLQSHHESMERLLDTERRFVPPEDDLLIYNYTPLYINHDGCVNTIKQECKSFYSEFGGDGRDWKTQSRFQCFYSPNNNDFVVLRFNKMKTTLELIIAAVVPIAVAFLSCVALCLCPFTRSSHVRDDSQRGTSISEDNELHRMPSSRSSENNGERDK